MAEIYDLMDSVLDSKAHEHMIGFAGFERRDAPQGPDLEGMVKVAAELREDGSGYLILTFLVDREPGATADPARTRLGAPDDAALRRRLGADFEMLIAIPLSEFSATAPFQVEEMDVYFRHLRGHERSLVEAGLFPALAELLGLRFEPLQDWRPPATAPAAPAEPRPDPAPPPTGLAARLRRWLGSA